MSTSFQAQITSDLICLSCRMTQKTVAQRIHDYSQVASIRVGACC